MASILRQIVAGPRSRHPEANLDLCYVTDNIIATSGPSATYPSIAYRNPLSDLVAFLDAKHGDQWCLFEFRAEGCGYPDAAVYNRIQHFPWPDHHPPPFALVPKILASMRSWLEGGAGGSDAKDQDPKRKRVAVVHCQAGKGRSGSMAVSYMMTYGGWNKADALQRFTERRMRPGFGTGVSIPSQLRWLEYVMRWEKFGGKKYLERAMDVTEVHVWGLRDGVKIAVEGYVNEGKIIKAFHIFSEEERDDAMKSLEDREDEAKLGRKGKFADVVHDVLMRKANKLSSRPRQEPATAIENQSTAETATKSSPPSNTLQVPSGSSTPSSTLSVANRTSMDAGSARVETPTTATKNVIFRPSMPIQLPSSDVNLAVERRAAAGYGFNTVTSVAHVWFNCFFEGNGPENYNRTSGLPEADAGGIFEIDWDAMDGIKGSSRKGTRAFDKVAVVWRASSANVVSPVEEPHERIDVKTPEPASMESIAPVAIVSSNSGMAVNDGVQMATQLGMQKEFTDQDGGRAGQVAEGMSMVDEDVEEDGTEGLRHGVVASSEQG